MIRGRSQDKKKRKSKRKKERKNLFFLNKGPRGSFGIILEKRTNGVSPGKIYVITKLVPSVVNGFGDSLMFAFEFVGVFEEASVLCAKTDSRVLLMVARQEVLKERARGRKAKLKINNLKPLVKVASFSSRKNVQEHIVHLIDFFQNLKCDRCGQLDFPSFLPSFFSKQGPAK